MIFIKIVNEGKRWKNEEKERKKREGEKNIYIFQVIS